MNDKTQALARLIEHGEHIFPLAHQGEEIIKDGKPVSSEEGKEPAPKWGSWKRAATVEDLTDQENDFRSWGWFPGASGRAVIDIDEPSMEGAVLRLEDEFGVSPLFVAPTGKPKRTHRCYGLPTSGKLGNGNWFAGTDTNGGQLRGTGGYVKLHGDAYIEKVAALPKHTEKTPEGFWDALIDKPAPVKRAAKPVARGGSFEENEWTRDERVRMLTLVPPEDDYDTWINICFAAKHAEIPDEAIERWSEGSHKFDEAARAKIASLEPDGRTGIGTLFFRAEQALGSTRAVMEELRPQETREHSDREEAAINDVDLDENAILKRETERYDKEFKEWWNRGRGRGKGYATTKQEKNSFGWITMSEHYFEDDFKPPIYLRKKLEKKHGTLKDLKTVSAIWGVPESSIELILEWGRKECYQRLEGANDELPSDSPWIEDRFKQWCEHTHTAAQDRKATDKQRQWARKADAHLVWIEEQNTPVASRDRVKDLLGDVWECVRGYPPPFIDDPYELAKAMGAHFSGAAKAKGEARGSPTDYPPFVAVTRPDSDLPAWFRVLNGSIGYDFVQMTKSGSSADIRGWAHNFAKGDREQRTRVYGAMRRKQGADGRWDWMSLRDGGKRTTIAETLNTLAGQKPFGYHPDSVDSDGAIVGVPGGGHYNFKEMLDQEVEFIGEEDRVWSPMTVLPNGMNASKPPPFRKLKCVAADPRGEEEFRSSEFYRWMRRYHPDGRDRLSRQIHAGLGLLGAKKRSGSIAIDWEPKGGAGKSSYGHLLLKCLGGDDGYGADIGLEHFTGSGRGSFTRDSALAKLRGRRFLFSSELDEETKKGGGGHLVSGLLKKVFGGDGVTTRMVGEDTETLRLLVAMLMGMNERPSISREDTALLERLRVNRVGEREGPEDKMLFDRIEKNEAHIVVRWMLDGAAAAFLLGDLPQTPRQALEEAYMVAKANPVGVWLDQTLEPSAKTDRIPLKEAHALCCQDIGEITLSEFKRSALSRVKIARQREKGSNNSTLHIIAVKLREE